MGEEPEKEQEADGWGDDLPEPEARLVESTLWKEDVYVLDHRAVWGSFYDPQVKRWGYACCRCIQKNSPCSVAKEAADAAKEAQSSEEYSPDSEVEREAPLRWDNPPSEMLPRSNFNKAGDFIEHFVRYIIGAWMQQQDRGFAGFPDMQKQAFNNTVQETIAAITPLIRRLRSGSSLERGERKENRGRCRETRTSMEGKFFQEASVLGQLELMVTMAYDLDYVGAHKAYMRLTLGNKTWNNTCVQHVAACTMKGAREYRRNRDNLNTYDMDPMSQRYMHAMRKLVHFAQLMKRNPDESKNLVL
jgi:hypothetical protein